MLGVGPGEDGGDRAGLGSPACEGPSRRCPSGSRAARLRQLRAEPRLCGAPPAAAHTRWYTETQGFRPGLRSIAKASFEPASGLAGLAPPADQSSLFPVTCRPRTSAWRRSGRDAHGLPCKPFGLTLVCCQPVVWDVPDRGFFGLAGTVVAAVSVCVGADGHPSHPSEIVGPEFDVGSPRPITARLTPVLAGRDRRRGREPQARGLRHDHSLRSTAIRRGDGSKRYAVSRPTPTPRA